MPAKWLIGMTSSSPTDDPAVSTEAVDVTRSRAGSHRNRSRPFFCRAPGRSPASVRTWKPLQMPTTGRRPGRSSPTAVHDRREAGDRPGAQVVAVREPAREHDRVDRAERRRHRARAARPGPGRARGPRRRRARSWSPGRRRRRSAAPFRSPRAPTPALFDHRVGEQPVGQLARRDPRRGLVRRVELEAERPPGAHVDHTVETQRGQRPLDRGALGVGDAGAQLHLDDGPANLMVVAPYQSGSKRPVTRS